MVLSISIYSLSLSASLLAYDSSSLISSNFGPNNRLNKLKDHTIQWIGCDGVDLIVQIGNLVYTYWAGVHELQGCMPRIVVFTWPS